VLTRVSKGLEENKQANNDIKLATKHVILNATISVHKETSMKTVAKTLGVHVGNITSVVLCCTVID